MTAPVAFQKDGYRLSLVQSEADLRAAQRLRYDVFVDELGGQGAGIDHDARLERDRFDALSDHLILRETRTDRVVGVYRVMRDDMARDGQGFYSSAEYDLSPLLSSGRRLLELGRSCVHPDHRNGTAMFHLWSGLARYIAHYDCDLLFGVASLKGTDVTGHAAALSLLHHRHLAPPDLRPRARVFQRMDLIAPEELDRRAAMLAIPPLVKSYLRLGGMVGEGAFVDTAFRCTDVCMVLDTARLSESQIRRYSGPVT